jgi:hypothetical protein
VFTKLLLTTLKAASRSLDRNAISIHRAIELHQIDARLHKERIQTAIDQLIAEREEADVLLTEAQTFYGS